MPNSGGSVEIKGSPQDDASFDSLPVVRYAGFWRRAVALMLDQIALMIGILFILAIFLLLMYPFVLLHRIDYKTVWGTSAMLPYLAYVPVLWLYKTIMESSRTQGTLGKMALGIIVTDMAIKRISFARANGRFWGSALSLYALGIGFIMAAFTKNKQALHDRVAGTLVLRSKGVQG